MPKVADGPVSCVLGVVEGDGIPLLFVMESLAWKAADVRSLDDLESLEGRRRFVSAIWLELGSQP